MDDVASRDLICGQLPALKDNRAEIEKLQSVVQRETANGVPVTKYQRGLYVAMDWVAARLHKAGAALCPLVLDGEEVECLSLLSLCMG
jgi:hypothetical protein